jgi:hypothetical protein
MTNRQITGTLTSMTAAGRAWAEEGFQVPRRLPRALWALAHQAVISENGVTLWASWEPSPPGASIVVLAGRATRVP